MIESITNTILPQEKVSTAQEKKVQEAFIIHSTNQPVIKFIQIAKIKSPISKPASKISNKSKEPSKISRKHAKMELTMIENYDNLT